MCELLVMGQGVRGRDSTGQGEGSTSGEKALAWALMKAYNGVGLEPRSSRKAGRGYERDIRRAVSRRRGVVDWLL